MLGGKWKAMILCYLKHKPCRYSELRALLPELSEKVLTERLKHLMAIGLVTQRKASGKGAANVYALSSKGHSTSKLLDVLYLWGEEHARAFDVELGDPLAIFHERERVAHTTARTLGNQR